MKKGRRSLSGLSVLMRCQCGCGVDTFVSVLVLAFAAPGSVVTLVPVDVFAFGVLTPVFTSVSLAGVALR